MHIKTEHRVWHYTLHFALAAFTLLFLLVSDTLFGHTLVSGTNLVFGSPVINVEGDVQKKLSFEKYKVSTKSDFFQEDHFSIGEESKIELNFSDFTVLRSDEKTAVSVLPDAHPSVNLSHGKIWVSTKEYATVVLPQALVEVVSGSVVVQKNKKGITLVTAWDKAAKITFFSKKNEKIWEFLLPAQHQIRFSPGLYFSEEEFDRFRLSKLQKEFDIKKIYESNFITQNIGLDEQWKLLVLRQINKRKSKLFNIDLKASIFEISPNTQSRDEKKHLREDVMTVWDVLDKKQFMFLKQKIEDLPAYQQKKFLQYAGFFPEEPSSLETHMQSFPSQVTDTWKNLWHLEALAILQSDDEVQIPVVQNLLDELEVVSQSQLENLEYIILAFFKNDIQTSTSIIHLLGKVEGALIEGEETKSQKATRKLEIVQTIFSVTDDLIEKKNFYLARKLLDTMKLDDVLDEEVLSLFSAAQLKLQDERRYKRGEVEYAEILGDDEKKEFREYLVLKDRLLEGSESLHSAPVVVKEPEYSIASVQKILEKKDIVADTIIIQESDTEFFISQGITEQNVSFSAMFDVKKEEFFNVLLHRKGEKDVLNMEHYRFSISEINDITPASVEQIAKNSQPKEVEILEVNKNAVPSEIIDFVLSITQNDFIAADILVSAQNMEVSSINEVIIRNSSPRYLALKEQEQLLKRSKKLFQSQNKYYSSSPAATTKYVPYSVDFTYQIETKMASDITAQYMPKYDTTGNGYTYVLEGAFSLEEMMKTIEGKIAYQNQLAQTSEIVLSQLSLSGFVVAADTVRVMTPSKTRLAKAVHVASGVEISASYNPLSQQFTDVLIDNIAENSIPVEGNNSLSELANRFFTQQKIFKAKVAEEKERREALEEK